MFTGLLASFLGGIFPSLPQSTERTYSAVKQMRWGCSIGITFAGTKALMVTGRFPSVYIA